MIDISIVTFNAECWLESFFLSLLKQKLPLSEISLLWLDNGSTDQTYAIIKQLQETHQGKFHKFQIAQGLNIGFGRGHNTNLRDAEADYFLVTNVDLEFETDTLVNLLAAAEVDAPQVAAWECRQKPYEHPKHYHPATGEVEWSSSACVLFRASHLKSVGGYEPALFLYGEDVDLSYRLRDAGYVLHYIPAATVWHYTYETEAQIKPAQFYGSTLANILLRCRFGKKREILSGFFMYLGLFALRPQFEGQRWGLFKNFFNLLRLAPHFLLTRRHSDADFPFRLWDYSLAREGAFYFQPKSLKPAQMPVVSVLVRSMPGRSGKLKEALASVNFQTYKSIELVVVEDGGSSAQLMCDELRKTNRFVDVKYLSLEKQGRCRAGNAALEQATGELICFLDDDDLFYADHLEILVDEWLTEPSLGAVYALAYQVRSEILSHEPWCYRDVDHSLIYRQKFSRGILWHHNYLPIQTVLFQRFLYQKYGGFDPDLENLEDWNLWVRYSLEYEFRMVPKVTSLYRVPAVPQLAQQRQSVLDDYYAIAQKKHAQLRVELSPAQVVTMANDLSQNLYVVSVSPSWLKVAMRKMPGTHYIYHPALKIRNFILKILR